MEDWFGLVWLKQSKIKKITRPTLPKTKFQLIYLSKQDNNLLMTFSHNLTVTHVMREFRQESMIYRRHHHHKQLAGAFKAEEGDHR